MEITLNGPNAAFATTALAQVPILPEHIWSVIDDPSAFANDEPVGSGPFKFESRALGEDPEVDGTYRSLQPTHHHYPPAAADPLLPHMELSDLMAESDNVILCASLNADSIRMINHETLSAIKPGAVLINIARGSLVDEEALVDVLDSGRLAGAALDVRDPEPPERRDSLSGRNNVIQTPHMAGASASALDDLHQLAAKKILHLLKDAGRL